MRGEGSPSPIYEGEDSVIARILDGKKAKYNVSLPKRNDTRCLKNRQNIVISSSPQLFSNDQILCFSSLDNALDYCNKDIFIENVFIIGGSQLYEEALHHRNLEYIYWNLILETDKECNIFFPMNMKSIYKTCILDNNYDMINLNSSKLQFNRFIANMADCK